MLPKLTEEPKNTKQKALHTLNKIKNKKKSSLPPRDKENLHIQMQGNNSTAWAGMKGNHIGLEKMDQQHKTMSTKIFNFLYLGRCKKSMLEFL